MLLFEQTRLSLVVEGPQQQQLSFSAVVITAASCCQLSLLHTSHHQFHSKHQSLILVDIYLAPGHHRGSTKASSV